MFSSKQFDPTKRIHKKNTIYVPIKGVQNVRAIWDWNETKRRYIKRETGKKFHAYKKLQGKQYARNFESFEQAKRWRDSPNLIEEEHSVHELTFAEVKRRFFEHKRTRVQITTLEAYEADAKHLSFFDPLPMSQITSRMIDAWLEAIKKKEYLSLQHSTRIHYKEELALLGYILKFYSERILEGESFSNPIKARHREDAIVDWQKYKESKDRNKRHFIPRKDFERFLEEMARRAMKKPCYAVYHAIAEVQLGGGPRIGEVCALEFEDVLDWNTGAVSISKTAQWSRRKDRPTRISQLTKTGDSRTIWLSARAMHVLRKWKHECGRSTGLIFSLDGINPVLYRSVQYHYGKAFKTLGMKWRSTHILRHSYATDFLEKTGGMKTSLQGQLGHKSSKQTDHYAKITLATQHEGVRAYNQSFEDSNVVGVSSVRSG